jgi:hypothetical protein
MAGGQKIDDHSSWVGKGKDGTVFPMGCKTKGASSAEGVGELAQYEDTSDAVKRQQELNKSKVKSHPMRPGYRV